MILKMLLFLLTSSFFISGSLGKDLCRDLSPVKGRCGEHYGRCNNYLDRDAVYCNENSGECGSTKGMRDITSGDRYDWKPSSCDRGVRNEGQDCARTFHNDCNDWLGNGNPNGPCKWCGEFGSCCRKNSKKDGCDGKMGGNGHHACVENPVIQKEPNCKSSLQCASDSFCDMVYGDQGFCEKCRAIKDGCENTNTKFPTISGREECKFVCENNGCYSTNDCKNGGGSYRDTDSFCDFNEGDRGQCKFCSSFPDGYENYLTATEQGRLEYNMSCTKVACNGSIDCPMKSFCNVASGNCVYCDDIDKCENLNENSEDFFDNASTNECQEVCEDAKWSIWRLLEAPPEGCNAANETVQESKCSGMANKIARVLINGSNFDRHNFHPICEFLSHDLDMFLLGMPNGKETCKALSNCLFDVLSEGKHFDAGKCVDNAVEAFMDDVESNMKRLIDDVGKKGHKIMDLTGKWACSQDPFEDLKKKIDLIKTYWNTIMNLPDALSKALYLTKDLMAPFRDDLQGNFGSSSILVSLDQSNDVSIQTHSSTTGVFFTFSNSHIPKLLELLVLGPDGLLLGFGIEVFESIIDKHFQMGFFQGFANGQSTDIANVVSFGSGITIQYLDGDIGVWGGYGFDISFPIDLKTPAEFPDIDFGMGLVFSAKPSNYQFPNGRQMTNQFLGFAFSFGKSYGPDIVDEIEAVIPFVLPEFTISRSCGYIEEINKNSNYSQCDTDGIDGIKKEINDVTSHLRDDFINLMEKCQEAWSCRVESCENTMFKANQAAKQCHDGNFCVRKKIPNWVS